MTVSENKKTVQSSLQSYTILYMKASLSGVAKANTLFFISNANECVCSANLSKSQSLILSTSPLNSDTKLKFSYKVEPILQKTAPRLLYFFVLTALK